MSSGPDFFQTGMGRRFYESTMPNIATALTRIAERLENPAPAAVPVRVWRKAAVEWDRITALLNLLANVGPGDCYCPSKPSALDPDGSCRCAAGDCDGCPTCPSGKARRILVAVGLA